MFSDSDCSDLNDNFVFYRDQTWVNNFYKVYDNPIFAEANNYSVNDNSYQFFDQMTNVSSTNDTAGPVVYNNSNVTARIL